MARNKKANPTGAKLTLSPEGEKCIRKLMAQIVRRESRTARTFGSMNEKARAKRRQRLEREHQKKMAWYDRFDKSIDKMTRQLTAMLAEAKRNRPAKKRGAA